MENKPVIFTKKSAKYRKKYNASVSALYGERQLALLGTDKSPLLKPPLKRKVKHKQIRLEDILQKQIVEWLHYLGCLVVSIPNHGRRSIWEGKKQVQMGLLAGASDLFLCEQNEQYNGYWIELKSPGKIPSHLQEDFGHQVHLRGYKWDWFDDFDIAQETILEYLGR